jgi:hypothetical protein
MTPDPTADPAADLQRRLRRLELRLERAEQTMVAAATLVIGVLLVLGLVLPLVSEGDGEFQDWDLPTGSLLTVAAGAMGGGSTSDDNAIVGVLLLALVAVTVAAMVSLALMAGEHLSARAARAVPALAAALLLGGIFVAGLAITASGQDADMDAGPGGVVFPAGTLAYAALAASRLRERWDPARRAHREGPVQRSN